MKEKGFTFALVLVAMCIVWSQAFHVRKETGLVCPVVSDEYTNYPVPNDCSRYFECRYGEPVVYSCSPGFLFDSVAGICNFASEVDCNGKRISTTPGPLTPTSSPAFVCPVVSEEYKNYADPTDCSKYYECHQGEKVSYSCPPGFLFDPIEEHCDLSDDVNCNGTNIPTTRSPVSPTTTTPGFVCPVVSEEYKNYADPKDCSKYYECHQGEKVSYSCPPGFLFDPIEEHCDLSEDVDCSGTRISTTRSPVTPTTSPDYCRFASEEYKNYPDPKNCSKYFECQQGRAISLSCPPGFLFNPSAGLCDFASNVNCNGTQTSTTPSPVSPTSSPDYCRSDSEEYKHYPDPKDCSKYFECQQGRAVSFSCPQGFLFNPSEGLCDFASNVNCNGTQISTTPSPVSPTSSPDYCRSDSEEYIHYPDPKDCSKFFECQQGHAVSFSCPQGLLFNPSTKVCDFASNVNCNGSQISTTPSPVSPTTGSGLPCPVLSDEYLDYPDPTNCSRYYECHLGQRSLMSCAPGFFFDPIQKRCNFASDVSCTPTPMPTTSTPYPRTTPKYNFECPTVSRDIKAYPDPFICSRYYLCKNGKKHEMNCAPNFVYNDKTEECDFMDKVDCNARSTIPTYPTGTATSTTVRPTTTPIPETSSNPTSTVTVTPTTQVTGSTGTTEPTDNVCQNKADGTYVADPNDCKVFYECSGGRAIKFTCPPDTTWDQSILTCDGKRTDC